MLVKTLMIARIGGAGSKAFCTQPKQQIKVLTIADIAEMVFNSNTKCC